MPFKTIIANSTTKIGPIVADWYRDKTGSVITPPYALLAIIDDNFDIKGVIWFYDYQEQGNVDIHIYTPGCFSRRTISFVFNYAFNSLKCTRVTAKVARKNKKLLRLLPRLGFEFEYIQRNYYKDDDAIVHVLHKEKYYVRP